MRTRTLPILIALLLPVGPVMANREVKVHDLATHDIRVEQERIRADVDAGKGPFKHIPADTRRRLFAHQAKAMKLIETVSRTTELSPEDQLALSNELQAIQSIIQNDEDWRMICERRQPVGTKRPQRVCMTVAERREAQEAGHDEVQRRGIYCDPKVEAVCR